MSQSPDSPHRKAGRGDEFQDPLENYDPKQYDDPLEHCLAEDSVLTIQSTPYASVPSSTPVSQAVKRLAELHVACLLVEDDGKLQGVFTDRDVLNNVALEYQQVKDRPVSEFMTPNPVYVNETDSVAAALCVMAVCGFRHVPVLRLDGKVLGIVSPQRVTNFLQERLRPSS
jgi:CBS domain-containing protein